jgi:hypothetical protein
LVYAVRKARGNQVGIKLNGIHQLLANADDLNLLGCSVNTSKKNTRTLIDNTNEIVLEMCLEETTYIL